MHVNYVKDPKNPCHIAVDPKTNTVLDLDTSQCSLLTLFTANRPPQTVFLKVNHFPVYCSVTFNPTKSSVIKIDFHPPSPVNPSVYFPIFVPKESVAYLINAEDQATLMSFTTKLLKISEDKLQKILKYRLTLSYYDGKSVFSEVFYGIYTTIPIANFLLSVRVLLSQIDFPDIALLVTTFLNYLPRFVRFYVQSLTGIELPIEVSSNREEIEMPLVYNTYLAKYTAEDVKKESTFCIWYQNFPLDEQYLNLIVHEINKFFSPSLPYLDPVPDEQFLESYESWKLVFSLTS